MAGGGRSGGGGGGGGGKYRRVSQGSESSGSYERGVAALGDVADFDDEGSITKRKEVMLAAELENVNPHMMKLQRKTDRMIRYRSNVMMFLSFVSLVLMVIWNQMTGDGDAIESTRLDKDFKVDRVIVEILMSAATALHILVLIEYVVHQSKLEKKSWFHTDCHKWRKHKAIYTLLEILLLLPHPFPKIPISLGRYFGLWMFVRTYSVLRVLRNNTHTYKERHLIKTNEGFRKVGAIDFDWALALKLLFADHGWVFVISATAYSIVMFAYMMYIWERITDPEVRAPWTYRTALWNTVITMATVGYGDTYAWTQEGRFTACVMAITGIILASLLIFVIMQKLMPTNAEKHAVTIHRARHIQFQQVMLAVRYIQLWWRRALIVRGKKHGQKTIPKDFHTRNLDFIEEMREMRREKALLEMAAGDAIDELEIDVGDIDEKEAQLHHEMKTLMRKHIEMKRALKQIADTQAQIMKLLGTRSAGQFHFEAEKLSLRKGLEKKPAAHTKQH